MTTSTKRVERIWFLCDQPVIGPIIYVQKFTFRRRTRRPPLSSHRGIARPPSRGNCQTSGAVATIRNPNPHWGASWSSSTRFARRSTMSRAAQAGPRRSAELIPLHNCWIVAAVVLNDVHVSHRTDIGRPHGLEEVRALGLVDLHINGPPITREGEVIVQIDPDIL